MQDSFGSTLRELRLAQRISLYALGAKTGINPGNLTRIERDVYLPGPRLIKRLSEALDVSYTDLLRASGHPLQELPTLRPYLRTTLGMTERDAADVERYIAEKYGTSAGPAEGEDEQDEEVI